MGESQLPQSQHIYVEKLRATSKRYILLRKDTLEQCQFDEFMIIHYHHIVSLKHKHRG